MSKKTKRTHKKKRKPRKITATQERTILTAEQTILSKERTILSFMRTGIAIIGVGIVVVSVLENVYLQMVGWVLIIIGFYETLNSMRRMKIYKKKMDKLKKRYPEEYI
jgi:uncharacterized membrane protein YidH (DUF202 family)